jgi:hypothetical protein
MPIFELKPWEGDIELELCGGLKNRAKLKYFFFLLLICRTSGGYFPK